LITAIEERTQTGPTFRSTSRVSQFWLIMFRRLPGGPTKQAIIDFVRRTCGEDGSPAVPIEERVAVFDNDGTLWCEKRL
jgi:hypothetical protein